MTPERLHDDAANRLAQGLSAALAPGGEYAVLTGVRAQLLDGFPDCLTAFDVAVTGPDPQWLVAAQGPVLAPAAAPRVAINVVSAKSLAEDFIRTPGLLARTGVAEYVLFDPTAEVLRPAFQTFRKTNGELTPLWPALHGVFFSHHGFRLDHRGRELHVSACPGARDESELFAVRWELEGLAPVDVGRRDRLRARIAQLEARRFGPGEYPGTGT